ncbi:hypothetical protein O59_001408 [Cellvibrio sp. BR]|nr:hypothetical protein O59_001408 [Cellvibrio sp. BR]
MVHYFVPYGGVNFWFFAWKWRHLKLLVTIKVRDKKVISRALFFLKFHISLINSNLLMPFHLFSAVGTRLALVDISQHSCWCIRVSLETF